MKKQINILTTNSYKLKEFAEVLSSDFKLLSSNLEIAEIQSMDQMELITKKAREAFSILKQPLCVDDFGFYIEKYNNFPGALTKYIFNSLGYKGLLKLVEECEPAYYRSLVAYYDGRVLKVFEGILRGKINKKIPLEYSSNSPINSIFIPDGYAEVFEKVKLGENFISHRKIALMDLKRYLLSL